MSRRKPQLTKWQSDLLDAVAAGLDAEGIAKKYKKNGRTVRGVEVDQDLGILRQQMGARNNGHMLEIADNWGWF